MGISLLSSYQGAQIFEAIGIGEDLLELGFYGTRPDWGLKVSELLKFYRSISVPSGTDN